MGHYDWTIWLVVDALLVVLDASYLNFLIWYILSEALGVNI